MLHHHHTSHARAHSSPPQQHQKKPTPCILLTLNEQNKDTITHHRRAATQRNGRCYACARDDDGPALCTGPGNGHDKRPRRKTRPKCSVLPLHRRVRHRHHQPACSSCVLGPDGPTPVAMGDDATGRRGGGGVSASTVTSVQLPVLHERGVGLNNATASLQLSLGLLVWGGGVARWALRRTQRRRRRCGGGSPGAGGAIGGGTGRGRRGGRCSCCCFCPAACARRFEHVLRRVVLHWWRRDVERGPALSTRFSSSGRRCCSCSRVASGARGGDVQPGGRVSSE
jgi:hypothetical protein